MDTIGPHRRVYHEAYSANTRVFNGRLIWYATSNDIILAVTNKMASADARVSSMVNHIYKAWRIGEMKVQMRGLLPIIG